MAIYAQQYFNTPHPPVPRRYSAVLSQTNDTLYREAANPSNSTPPSPPLPVSDAPPEGTQYFKLLDSPPADLFNTTNDVNIASASIDPRWSLMVGPPLDDTSDNPSSCVYTVTSEIGITTAAYTIQPTVATICWCDGSVMAGIVTVTATSTSYLVCEVPNSITVSTLGPPTSTSSSPPPATTSPDMSSPQCQACDNALGASSCAASDPTCLVNQCLSNQNCKSCGVDCNSYGSTS